MAGRAILSDVVRRRADERPHARERRHRNDDPPSGHRGRRGGDGDPRVGIRLCRLAIENGKHIVMINVEADALAGPPRAPGQGGKRRLFPRRATSRRSCASTWIGRGRPGSRSWADKGTRYLPTYHQSNPDTVWDILSQYIMIKPEDRGSINPTMFNSFLDDTKSGIEMTAICNATGLHAQSEGPSFPPASRFELAEISKPASDGGVLESAGVTRGDLVAPSRRLRRPSPPRHRYPTWSSKRPRTATTCAAASSNIPCSRTRPAATPPYTGRADPHDRARARISAASAALRREATGAPICFNSDVLPTAKRDFKSGEMLDGEGGFCMWASTPRCGRATCRSAHPTTSGSATRSRPESGCDGATWRSTRPTRGAGPPRHGSRLHPPRIRDRRRPALSACRSSQPAMLTSGHAVRRPSRSCREAAAAPSPSAGPTLGRRHGPCRREQRGRSSGR